MSRESASPPDPALTAAATDRQPVIRPGARVILFDDADRVLLFASVDDAGRRFWFPSGGGSEPGESAEETARRELREETGLTDVNIIGELGRRQATVSWGSVTYDCRERWFLARTAAFAIDTGGFSPEEHAAILTARWWSAADLAQSPDRLVPRNLAALVAQLLASGAPGQPLDLLP